MNPVWFTTWATGTTPPRFILQPQSCGWSCGPDAGHRKRRLASVSTCFSIAGERRSQVGVWTRPFTLAKIPTITSYVSVSCSHSSWYKDQREALLTSIRISQTIKPSAIFTLPSSALLFASTVQLNTANLVAFRFASSVIYPPWSFYRSPKPAGLQSHRSITFHHT